MFYDVASVNPVGTDTLAVRFQDGLEGTVKCLPGFFRGVFTGLKDPHRFNEVQIVDGVITWPGELDLAPDAMHRAIKAHGVWVLD